MKAFLKIAMLYIILVASIPCFYLIYDRMQMPPAPEWQAPPYTPGQKWEQYAQDFLKKNPEPNALTHYLVALSKVTVTVSQWGEREEWDKEVNEILREGWNKKYPTSEKFLELNQSAIQELVAGLKMETCEFPPTPYYYNAWIPNYLHMQYLGKWMALKGKQLESQKKYHEALQYYLWGIQFGKEVGQKDQAKMSHLLGIWIIRKNTECLNQLILQNKLPGPDYSRIIQASSKAEQEQSTYKDVIQYEYQVIYTEYPKELNEPYKWTQLMLNAPGEGFSIPTTKVELEEALFYIPITGYLYLNKGRLIRNYINFYEDLLNNASTKSYLDFVKIDWKTKYPNDLDTNWNLYMKNDSDLTVYLRDIVPVYTRENVEISLLRIAQIQSAIYLYHLQKREWPKSQTDLKEYLNPIPIDPFTDKPFLSAQENGVPLVYSSGPDIKDNQGQILYDPTNGARSAGDIRP